MKVLQLTYVLAAVALFGCELSPVAPSNLQPAAQGPDTTPANPAASGPEVPDFAEVDVQTQPGVQVDLMPGELELAPATRQRRRMDLDQLDASLRRVTGGIGWMVGTVNQFDTLAGTLGKPNFTTTTREDLDATAMFQKFLGDGARSVCFDLMEREVTEASSRVLLVHVTPEDTLAGNPDGVERNIQAALLRFHGRSAASLGGELAQWKWLYRSAEHVAQDPVVAWRTLCVGLLTHPDFYTY